MKRGKYLAKNTALFALNVVGTKLIAFLLVPLYTKAFTTSEYGMVDLINTISVILVPVITLNIGEAVMRFALDENADKKEISNIGILFAGLSFLLGFLIIPIMHFFLSLTVDYHLVYLFCVSQGLYVTFSYNLRGQEKLVQYAVGNILCTFMMAALNILFLVVFKSGIKGFLYSYIISYIISTLYCVVKGGVFGHLRHFKINSSLAKQMVKYSIVLVPNSFMWWIMNSSDHIMVTSMISIEANGIYAISYRIPSILTAFLQVFNQAWLYSAIHEDKSADRTEFNNNMFDKLVRLQLLITIFLMLIMKPFLKLYVSAAYYEAWKYTPYLFVGYFFLTMGTFLSTSYTVNKDTKGFLISGTTGAIINIALNAILIPFIGVHGAALATCISYIFVFLYRVHDIQKYIVINVFKRSYVIGYILLMITAASMFINGVIGLIILIIEMILGILLNIGFIKECIVLAKSLISKVLGRKSNG